MNLEKKKEKKKREKTKWSNGKTWRKRGGWRCKWWPAVKGFRLIRPTVTDQRLGLSERE